MPGKRTRPKSGFYSKLWRNSRHAPRFSRDLRTWKSAGFVLAAFFLFCFAAGLDPVDIFNKSLSAFTEKTGHVDLYAAECLSAPDGRTAGLADIRPARNGGYFDYEALFLSGHRRFGRFRLPDRSDSRAAGRGIRNGDRVYIGADVLNIF